MTLDKLFSKLNKARQAISDSLDVVNHEAEIRKAISVLEAKGWTDPGAIEDKQLDALYSIKDTLAAIDSELDSWELELINCQAIPAPTE